ncbi:MAG: hypothetical protein NUW37_15150 [Planctomycetes bacterium]|nr:hypothetical protein [Planctomycetota bacterium]
MEITRDAIPSLRSTVRAAVSMVPGVGGALDHLFFDKADEIASRNINASLTSLSEEIRKIGEDRINKDWFESEEAIATFKLLFEKIVHEPDKPKIDLLSRVVGVCSTPKNVNDRNKRSVIEHLARLSSIQIRLLSVISKTQVRSQSTNNGGLLHTVEGIWFSDIKNSLESSPPFWEGTLLLDEELDVLVSFNTIARINIFSRSEAVYLVTLVGRRAASYLNAIGP